MKTLIELCDADPMDMVRLKYLVHGERMAYALSNIDMMIKDNAKTVQRSDVLRQIRAYLNDLGVDINELMP